MEEQIKPKGRIKNKNYLSFLAGEGITILHEQDINKVLEHINAISRYPREARCLVITLYLTGARPAEVLLLRQDNFRVEKREYCIKFEGKVKKTLPREIRLSLSLPMVKELMTYVSGLPPSSLLFYHFKGDYKRSCIYKGMPKQYHEISYRLRYHFQKWTSVLNIGEIPPYYLRHNRFSKLSEAGLTDPDLKFLKGSRTYESIEPYRHLSKDRATKLARKIK